jgi:hypothetical protein
MGTPYLNTLIKMVRKNTPEENINQHAIINNAERELKKLTSPVLLAEKLEIAEKALRLISFQTEDMFPPYREIPRSKMVEIADGAIKKIEELRI